MLGNSQGVLFLLQGVLFLLQGVLFLLQGVLFLLQGVLFLLQGVLFLLLENCSSLLILVYFAFSKKRLHIISNQYKKSRS